MTDLDVLQVGVCVDASGSVNPAVVNAVTDSLSVFDTKLEPIVTGVTEDRGYPGVRPVHLVVRQVAGAALGLENEIRHVLLPGVPVLAPEPKLDEGLDSFRASQDVWEQARADIVADIDRATAARAALGTQLDSLAFREGGSEIVGCLTALAETFDPFSQMELLLVTDLDQRGEPQARGDLTNARIRVIHDCQDVGVCQDQQASLRSLLEQLGVVPNNLSFSSPSRLDIELDAALQ